MSWFGNTLLPVIEDVWLDREPPVGASAGAEELRQAGHDDVAGFIAKMSDQEFEDLVWQVTCSRSSIQQEESEYEQ